jgi:CRP-like cAMP-binding protein/predicted acylesterase/phospholipase RssA
MTHPPRGELPQRLRASKWFRHVEATAWEGCVDRLEWLELPAGETLFRQGDPGDALYVVFSGHLRAFIVADDGGEVPLTEVGPGGSVGEIQVLTGGVRSATVAALEACELVKVPTDAFDQIAQASPEMLQQMLATNRRRLDRSLLAEVLPGLCGPLTEQDLRFLDARAEWVDLQRGEKLFEAEEVGERMYVLLTGRLEAVITDERGTERVIGEVRRGESVGEMALLTDKPRSAAIRALRDSRLVSYSKESFEQVTARFPRALIAVTRILVERLGRATARAPVSGPGAVSTIAVVSAVTGREFADRLAAALSARGPTLCLNRRLLDQDLGIRTGVGETEDHPAQLRLTAWLDDQEVRHRFVLYEADPEPTDWTRRCLRQADQILLVCPAEGPFDDELLRGLLACEGRADATERATLVTVHADDRHRPRGTAGRLAALGLTRRQHVRWQRQADFERLARLFDGAALGLVLGGGGARAFAHIGVIQAFCEAGIEIDMIGGTSLGAMIAIQFALGLGPEEMVAANRKAFIEGKPHYDITLPLFGLIPARRAERILERDFGGIELEDLWLNCFAISANLTTARQMVLQHGPVGKVIRASTALPGVIVPVVWDHELLADGGLLNNVPGDVMRTLCGGRVVSADVSPSEHLGFETAGDRLPSPWKVLWSRLNPLMRAIEVPNLAQILSRAATLASVQNAASARPQADLYLDLPVDGFNMFDVNALERIVEIGYRHARERIAEWVRTDGPAASP